jgi:hypothetical protein
VIDAHPQGSPEPTARRGDGDRREQPLGTAEPSTDEHRFQGESRREEIHGETLPPARAEERSFASRANADLRADLLVFLDEELHRPLMAAEPHPFSEEHRRRLLNAQETVRAEMARIGVLETAEEVALTLLARIEAGELDALDADAQFLGFRSIDDLGRELAVKAKAAGIDCQAPIARTRRDLHELEHRRAQSWWDHQERLLDEGIEETFPASDPVSISEVDDDS